MRLRADEVVAPYVVAVGRFEPYTRAVVEPQSSSWPLLLRYFQPLAMPDTLHAILTHPPASSLQQCRDAAITVTTVLAGKLDDRLLECIFVFTPYRTIALCAARLVGQPACPALRHPMLLLRMSSSDASSLRAQKFPEAKSFNTRLSRLRSDTRRFSLELSCSSFFSGFAWVHLQPTVLLTPAKVRLRQDTGFLTRQSSRLPVRNRCLNLPQQIHWHILSRALRMETWFCINNGASISIEELKPQAIGSTKLRCQTRCEKDFKRQCNAVAQAIASGARSNGGVMTESTLSRIYNNWFYAGLTVGVFLILLVRCCGLHGCCSS